MSNLTLTELRIDFIKKVVYSLKNETISDPVVYNQLNDDEKQWCSYVVTGHNNVVDVLSKGRHFDDQQTLLIALFIIAISNNPPGAPYDFALFVERADHVIDNMVYTESQIYEKLFPNNIPSIP